MDREARIAEIAASARAHRKRWPRGVWTWSIAIAVVCVGSLTIAMIQECDTKPIPVHSSRSKP